MKAKILSHHKIKFCIILTLFILLIANSFAMAVHAEQVDPTTGLTINDNGQYEINSATDYQKFLEYILKDPLQAKQSNFKDKTVVLTTDIDTTQISLSNFSDLCIAQFAGTFNGQGHTIMTNCKTTENAAFSIIPVITKEGIVENLKVKVAEKTGDSATLDLTSILNGSINNISSYGILTNKNSGTILACEITGDVQIDNQSFYSKNGMGRSILMGSIGELSSTGIVQDCHSSINYTSKEKKPFLRGYTTTKSKRFGINKVYGSVVLSQFDAIGYSGATLDRCYTSGSCENGYFTADQLPATNNYTNYIAIQVSSGQASGTVYYDKSKLTPIYQAGGKSDGPDGLTYSDTAAIALESPIDKTDSMYDSKKIVASTTADMQYQAYYSGWNFDSLWKIDAAKATNEGYPYIAVSPKAAFVTVQPVIADKTYTSNTDLTATVTGVTITGATADVQKLIDASTITADFKVKEAKFEGVKATDGAEYLQMLGNGQTVDVTFDSLTVKSSDESVVPIIQTVKQATGNVVDNRKSGPTTDADKQAQIDKAKEAEKIVLDGYMGDGSAWLTPFTLTEDSSGVKSGKKQFSQDMWAVFSAARAGYFDQAFYDKWFANVKTSLHAMKEAGVTQDQLVVTEWDKLAMAITAAGYDVRDITDYDILGTICNKNNFNTGYVLQGQYNFFAVKSAGYAVPSSVAAADQVDFQNILDEQKTSIHSTWLTNGVGNAGVISNGDNSMYIQPLYTIYNSDEQVNKDINTIFHNYVGGNKSDDQSHDILQNADGSFTSTGYTNNAWNNAQNMISLGVFNMSVFDKDFIKDGNTVLDAQFQLFDFNNRTYNFKYEPMQIVRGFDSVVRQYERRNNIYDTSDVKGTKAVNDAINALTDTSTEADVQAVRTAYDALTSAQKDSIQANTYKKLTDQEARLNINQDAAKVAALIEALPEAAKVQLSDASAISAARSAYDALTDNQKRDVSNYSKLTADEAALNALKDAQSAAEAVAAVQKQIAALPDAAKVKAGDADAIAAARKAYDALPAAEQAQVTNLKHLTDAEAALKDIQAADAVTKAIDALPAAGEIKKSDADAIAAARKAYDALTDGQKKQVTNLDKLTAAEAALKALDTATLDYQAGSGTLDSNWQSGGSTSGTTGQGLKVTALRAKVVDGNGNAIDGLGVSYSVHLQNLGWRAANADGQTAGSGDLRVEALKMTLTGAKADQYDVYYRVHVQDIGWMNWAKNGDMAGTTGFAYQIEALQAVLVPKGGSAPAASPANNTEKSGITAENVRVDGHSQNIGWTQGWQQGNQIATATVGTTGQALRLEAFKLESADSGLQLHYQAHVQNIGWQKAVDAGATAGTTGQGLRLEALKIWATGDSAAKVSVQYRVHVQNTGWTDWVTAGSTMENAPAAGTTGQGLRIEALQVRTVEK